jgi:hypothetical protein
MSKLERVVEFDGPEALGARFLDLLHRFRALESITPGLTADWGLEIDGKVFVIEFRGGRA